MKTLIFQVAVGEVPDFYDICMASVNKYATRIGADYKVITEPVLKIKPLNSQRSKNAIRLNYLPIFEKEVAFDYLDDYDAICIIDADIYIRESAPNIFNQLDDDTVFAGVLERDMPLTPEYIKKIRAYSIGQYSQIALPNWKQSPTYGYDFYNMGLMLFSNKIKKYLKGDTPKQFIQRKEFEKFVNGEGNLRFSTDQSLLNTWVRNSGMNLKNLDWQWNALFKGIVDNKLHESYFIHFFLSNNLPQKGKEIPNIIENLSSASNIKGHR